MPQWTLQDTAQIVIWHCTVIVFLHGRLHSIYPFLAYELPSAKLSINVAFYKDVNWHIQ